MANGHEEMLGIARSQGNASHSHSETTHTCQNGYRQKSANSACWTGCEEMGTCVPWGGTVSGAAARESAWGVLRR